MALRYIRARKGLTYLREKRTSVPTRIDQLETNPYLIARDELVPAAVEMQKKAVKVDRVPVHFFQKMSFGRECSCTKFRYKSPDKTKCNICFGKGIVGGFNKIGTRLEVIDSTRPGLSLSGIEIDDSTCPYQFKLRSDSLTGNVDVVLDIPVHTDVDAVVLYSSGDVKAYVKKIDQPSYTLLSRSSLRSIAKDQKQLNVRITLSRASLSDQSPTFTHLYIRWMINETDIYVDMSRKTVSVSMQEFNLPDLLQSISVYIPATISRVTTSDFFIVRLTPDVDIDVFRDEGKRRYKITEVTANKALGTVVSWDVTARLVQAFENYSRVPE